DVSVMKKVSTKQRIENALEMASSLATNDPRDPTMPIVVEQLKYLKEVYERDGSFDSIPKGKMTIGVIAAKEYDTSRPRLARLLHDISWVLNHGSEPKGNESLRDLI